MTPKHLTMSVHAIDAWQHQSADVSRENLDYPYANVLRPGPRNKSILPTRPCMEFRSLHNLVVFVVWYFVFMALAISGGVWLAHWLRGGK